MAAERLRRPAAGVGEAPCRPRPVSFRTPVRPTSSRRSPPRSPASTRWACARRRSRSRRPSPSRRPPRSRSGSTAATVPTLPSRVWDSSAPVRRASRRAGSSVGRGPAGSPGGLEVLSPEKRASNLASFLQVCRFPPASDYEGDGKVNLATWTSSGSAVGTWSVTSTSTGGKLLALPKLGVAGDVPVPGDYDGDGKTDQATWNPATGIWTVTLSSTNKTATTTLAANKGEVAVPGDYDG